VLSGGRFVYYNPSGFVVSVTRYLTVPGSEAIRVAFVSCLNRCSGQVLGETFQPV
jgi:hypothetical protein